MIDFDFKPIVSVEEIDEKAPEELGIYIGYNPTKDNVYLINYVGQTKNLRKRLHRHPSPCTHFSFEEYPKNELDEVEKRLINIFVPSSNYQLMAKERRGRRLLEEWIIKDVDNPRELWVRPDPILDKSSLDWFKPRKIKKL